MSNPKTGNKINPTTFGNIIIIQLDPENIAESQILFPAKANTEIDWNTLNRLYPEKGDFCKFLKLISENHNPGKAKSRSSVAERVKTKFFEED